MNIKKITTKTALVIATSAMMSGSVFAACSADIDMNSNKITNLGTPTVSTDAVNKGYVDSKYAYYNSVTDSIPSTAVGALIDLTAEVENNSGGVISESGDVVTVTETGKYLVSFTSSSVDNTNSWIESTCGDVVNNRLINSNSLDAGNTNRSNFSVTMVCNMTAGNMTIQFKNIIAAQRYHTKGTHLYVRKL
jgi:hypothetical protein